MILKIVQAGDPVLRERARDLTVEEIRSAEIQQLILLMRETMREAPGVGLAAPQVGLSLRLAVIEDPSEFHDAESQPEMAARERQSVPFHVLINPRLTVEDATPVEFHEGCLSLDGYCALVPRARGVRVDALDENGKPFTRHARGWYARILQHECDHLDGGLYIDRMATRSFATNENHSRWWAGRTLEDVKETLGI